jgi:hypothetical protein
VSEGAFAGAPTSFYDLFRVQDGTIAKHWDTIETIPPPRTWKNQNGKFDAIVCLVSTRCATLVAREVPRLG